MARIRLPTSEGLGHQALKDFAIYPSDRVQVSRQSVATFISLFHFLFLFSFSFIFYLEDYIGLLLWVTQTCYGSSTDLRPILQSEKRYIASQPIDKN